MFVASNKHGLQLTTLCTDNINITALLALQFIENIRQCLNRPTITIEVAKLRKLFQNVHEGCRHNES